MGGAAAAAPSAALTSQRQGGRRVQKECDNRGKWKLVCERTPQLWRWTPGRTPRASARGNNGSLVSRVGILTFPPKEKEKGNEHKKIHHVTCMLEAGG
eukprot:7509709-Pyramimonas_sp.AAC.1